MEEKTAQRLVKEVGQIRDFLMGNPEFKEKGFIDRFSDLETKVTIIDKKVDNLERNGVKVKWWWTGAAAGGGIATGVAGKSTLAKIIAAIGTLFSTKP